MTMRFHPLHKQNRVFLFIGLAFLSCNSDTKPPAVKEDTMAMTKDRTVSIQGFWIDSSEISSNEYREYEYPGNNK
jgi:hypothetical protein